jgi:BirA family biotin operon repressor/biotin-[acetyl-CoA-carboxylase] ligase
MAIALAIVDALQEVGIKSGIKWPNDILIKDRKIAGILTEAITDMDGIEFIVSGIGLNVNTLIEDFPAELRPIVTSVREEAGRMVSRVHLLQILLLKLEQRYQQLISGAFTEILEQVRTLSLVIGRDITIKQLGGITEGRAIDIDNNGFLLVRDGQGNIHHLMSGEVLLKPQ